LPVTIALAEDPVYFADPNLKAAIEAELGVTNPDATDMLGLYYLYVYDKEITNLTGLEYAVNLIELDLRYNQISDINAISGLTNLTFLYLTNNQISDISAVSGLTNLTHLYLFYNQISDINAISGLTELTILYLNHNQISDINAVSGLTNLTSLYLTSNQLKDINAVCGLTNLTTLYLTNNQISDINAVSGLTNLTSLSLSINRISDINAIVSLSNLTWASLLYNPLNTRAYCSCIPLIEENNPGINLEYDPNPNPMTEDCYTDFSDYAIFSSHWLETDCDRANNWCGGADLDHIYDVDFYDMEEFDRLWINHSVP